jgi:hypothetical protein
LGAGGAEFPNIFLAKNQDSCYSEEWQGSARQFARRARPQRREAGAHLHRPRFKNDTERLERLFERYTKIAAAKDREGKSAKRGMAGKEAARAGPVP